MGPVETLQESRRLLDQWYKELEEGLGILQSISVPLRNGVSFSQLREAVVDHRALDRVVECCILATYSEVLYRANKKALAQQN